MGNKIDSCRACGSKDLMLVFDLGEQKFTGRFPKSREENVPSGELALMKCNSASGCGLVQLGHSFDSAELYGAHYGYRSGLNESMVNHLRSKVKSIQAREILNKGDLLIDIGSNDGTTLGLYEENGYALVGVDPTAAKFRSLYKPEINVIEGFFTADLIRNEFSDRKAKVITSFSMFYDLEDPMRFVRDIAAVLAEDGVWVFEQSYLPLMLEANSFDTICHEHLEYYTLSQIRWMLEKAGLRIVDVELNDINGGSISIVATQKVGKLVSDIDGIELLISQEQNLVGNSSTVFSDFSERVNEQKELLLKFLIDCKDSGKSVVGVGASTKGNVLLQYYGISAELIPAIAEVNVEKYGSFTPGTLIPIQNEGAVLANNPDYLVVLPWHFREYFLTSPIFKNRKLVFPLPKFEIVDT